MAYSERPVGTRCRRVPPRIGYRSNTLIAVARAMRGAVLGSSTSSSMWSPGSVALQVVPPSVERKRCHVPFGTMAIIPARSTTGHRRRFLARIRAALAVEERPLMAFSGSGSAFPRCFSAGAVRLPVAEPKATTPQSGRAIDVDRLWGKSGECE